MKGGATSMARMDQCTAKSLEWKGGRNLDSKFGTPVSDSE